MTKIQRYTMSNCKIVAGVDKDGNRLYSVEDMGEVCITGDSCGAWVKHEDHINALIEQGDELAMLRLQLAEKDETISLQKKIIDQIAAET